MHKTKENTVDLKGFSQMQATSRGTNVRFLQLNRTLK